MTSPLLSESHPLTDMLVAQATEGLDPAAYRQLLFEARYLGVDDALFDETAAAVDLAFQAGRGDDAALPPWLAQRAASSARKILMPSNARTRVGTAFRWASAALVLLACGWILRSPSLVQTPRTGRELLLRSPDTIRIDWSRSHDERMSGVQGDVVWNPTEQRGYLLLQGLPANDPQRQRYQLWVVDGLRQQSQPIDGGLFDHPGTHGEAVIIAFTPALPIGHARLFAITIEPPAGVVVSQGPLRLIATAP